MGNFGFSVKGYVFVGGNQAQESFNSNRRPREMTTLRRKYQRLGGSCERKPVSGAQILWQTKQGDFDKD